MLIGLIKIKSQFFKTTNEFDLRKPYLKLKFKKKEIEIFSPSLFK